MIVLDTHTLVWWVGADAKLSTAAKHRIETELDNDGLLAISSISAWEIAMLVAHGRLTLTMAVDDWLETVARIDGVRFIPVDNHIAIASTQLPEPFHKDPADRLIVALARQLNAPLITADSKLQSYPHVHTLW
jgi:PIN domain nuclease of toxin-antitoxin system